MTLVELFLKDSAFSVFHQTIHLSGFYYYYGGVIASISSIVGFTQMQSSTQEAERLMNSWFNVFEPFTTWS